MSRPELGINVQDLQLPTKTALEKAAELDFRAIELPTVAGQLAPSNLSKSGRRHLSHLVSSLGLRLAALVADAPQLRLTDPQTVDQRVELTASVLGLASDLKVPTVTAAVGALTHPETKTPSPLAVEALKTIGEAADARGVFFCLRPSYDSGDRIVRVLDELRCPSLGVCVDPAEQVMHGANPFDSIDRFVEQVRLIHVRDGTAGLSDRTGHETRLGEGDVDLVGLLAILDAADYQGPHIIRRTDSQNPARDLSDARETLKHLLPP
ncbi:MAG: sugar phosphate isomerase/epimerase family protein [Phycisphaerae bacterium]|jgi:sugar phosphate isomerase/epimerase